MSHQGRILTAVLSASLGIVAAGAIAVAANAITGRGDRPLLRAGIARRRGGPKPRPAAAVARTAGRTTAAATPAARRLGRRLRLATPAHRAPARMTRARPRPPAPGEAVTMTAGGGRTRGREAAATAAPAQARPRRLGRRPRRRLNSGSSGAASSGSGASEQRRLGTAGQGSARSALDDWARWGPNVRQAGPARARVRAVSGPARAGGGGAAGWARPPIRKTAMRKPTRARAASMLKAVWMPSMKSAPPVAPSLGADEDRRGQAQADRATRDLEHVDDRPGEAARATRPRRSLRRWSPSGRRGRSRARGRHARERCGEVSLSAKSAISAGPTAMQADPSDEKRLRAEAVVEVARRRMRRRRRWPSSAASRRPAPIGEKPSTLIMNCGR